MSNKYVVITIWFKCNSSCEFCLLWDLHNSNHKLSLLDFAKIVKKISEEGIYDSIILSWWEITLEPDLFKYLEIINKIWGFKNIRIQTNGQLLSNIDLCNKLIEYGVNEYFISINWSCSNLNDVITNSHWSFDKTMRWFLNLDSLWAHIISNTVITTSNLNDLLDIFKMLSLIESIKEINLWNYMTKWDWTDLHLIVDYNNLKNVLVDIFRLNNKLNFPKKITFFNIPDCVLISSWYIGWGAKQPDLISFWDINNKVFDNCYECSNKDVCSRRGSCIWIQKDYISKYWYNFNLLLD